MRNIVELVGIRRRETHSLFNHQRPLVILNPFFSNDEMTKIFYIELDTVKTASSWFPIRFTHDPQPDVWDICRYEQDKNDNDFLQILPKVREWFFSGPPDWLARAAEHFFSENST